MKRADFTRSFFALAILAVVGLAVPLSAQPKYVVNDLGTLGGTTSQAAAINNSGQVAGFASLPGDTISRAFRTAPNAPINPATDDLGTLGGTSSGANGINDSGQVAGTSIVTGDLTNHAFRTAANAPINPATDDLGTLGGILSEAEGINNAGQVVGEANLVAGGDLHAFRTGPNAPIHAATDDLGILGGTGSLGHGINNLGQVVGGGPRAFRTAPNALINPATDDLGTLGGTFVSAFAINSSGQVVGTSYVTGDTTSHAFRTAANAPINPATDDLGSLGGTAAATSINNSGDVAGASLLSVSGIGHAFVYKGGVLYDLNSQLYSASGWELQYAAGINDVGQIVGYGVHNGETRAFRLDPLITVGIIVNAGIPPPVVFNIDSEGAIPVAILGSATFDVTTIDPTSVQFGPKGAKNSRTPVLQDVNHDGKLDLVLYFSPHSAGIGCTDTSVALIGTTHSKQLLFTGSEAIKTTHTFPCK